MKESKFIKKENDLAEYEIEETTKGAKGVNGKEYKAEKIVRRETNEKKKTEKNNSKSNVIHNLLSECGQA